MPRHTAASANATPDDDFDYPAKLCILRRAVAELVVLADAADVAARVAELQRLCNLAEMLVSSLAREEARRPGAGLRKSASATLLVLYRLRERLEVLAAQRPSRAAVEATRRSLYFALAALSERLAPRDGVSVVAARCSSELDRALAMRLLVSDFHGAMLATVRGRSNKSWSLAVAQAELAIVLGTPAFAAGPKAQRRQLRAVFTRVSRFRTGKRGALLRSRIQAKALATPALLASLSQRPDVKQHDARSLVALGALLSSRRYDPEVAAHAAEILASLRGMDLELDRLMLELPFDAARVLKRISQRVGGLRQRLLAC